MKIAKLEKAELNREIGMCTLTPTTPMSISGNPIYEPFGPCAELQHIPRCNVALIKYDIIFFIIPFEYHINEDYSVQYLHISFFCSICVTLYSMYYKHL